MIKGLTNKEINNIDEWTDKVILNIFPAQDRHEIYKAIRTAYLIGKEQIFEDKEIKSPESQQGDKERE